MIVSGTPAPCKKTLGMLPWEYTIVSIPIDDGPSWYISFSPFTSLRLTPLKIVATVMAPLK